MRTLTKAFAATALAATALLGTGQAAVAAQPKDTTAKIIGNVHITGDTTAVIRARYVCNGNPDQVHLWVSVKQNAYRTADPALAQEGSSQVAAAWSQSHGGQLICDGRKHTGAFTVDQTEQGFGTLSRGQAWVQFCLFDATTGPVPLSVMEFIRLT
jgi:hypothetical protein